MGRGRQRLAEAARSLERGGAEFILICANTMHKLAPPIEAAVKIPFLHIADATARARVELQGLNTGRPARHALHHGRRLSIRAG